MEIKNSKVVKYNALEKREGQQYQAYSVTFEDGVEGITFAQYKVGEVGQYYVEVKQGKNGEYKRIMKPKQDRGSFQGGKARYYWPSDYTGKAISMGMAYSKDLFKDPVIGTLGLTNIHSIIVPAILAKLDTLTSERQKEFCLTGMAYATQMVLDEDTRKRMLESFKVKEATATSLMEMVTRLFDGIIKAMVGYDRS